MSGSWSNTETSLIILVEEVSGMSGLFGYSPAPGHGTLVFSVTAAAGTDAYGNDYIAGLTVYNEAAKQFAQMVAGATLYGIINGSGVPDTADAGRIFGTAVTGTFPAGILQLQSPVVAIGAPDGATLGLYSGSTGGATGNLANPQVLIGDLEDAAPTDGYITGNWFASTVPPGGISTGGNALVTPTLSAGFTNDNLEWAQIAVGCVLWQGEFAMNAASAGAGTATIYTLPAGYRPKKEVIVPVSWRTSTGLAKGSAYLAFETTGVVTLAWGAATAAGDRFSCSVPFLIA